MKKIAIKMKVRKKPIQKNLRLAIIIVFSIIFILSAYGTYAAFQQPTTTEKTITTCEYSHTGKFSYIVYLKNNSVYNNASTLYPGQGIIFKKITDHINASFSYTFTCNQTATVQGHYTVYATVQTDLWSKNYIIIPKTEFNTPHFTITFPINYTYFEEIVSTINDEIGVNARTPTLNMTCSVTLSALTTTETIHESFSPLLSMPLEENIIEFDSDLTRYQTGSLEGTTLISQSGVIEQKTNGIIISLVSVIIIVLFAVFTASRDISVNVIEKQVKKIKKKYGEWIVEVEQLPETKKTGTVSVKTIDDLTKISEELGKPIIHYQNSSNPDGKHEFYVLDGKTTYQYVLNVDGGITKTVQCPHCNSITVCNVDMNKEIDATCSKCGNNFRVSFEEDSNLLTKIHSFITGKK
jgi:hypothetical protein